MKALYLTTHLSVENRPTPTPGPGQCLVKICSAGVNPSDVLGTTGYFPHAKLPRIPGRDFSGVIVQGSPQLIGKRIWGTGGAAGLDFDGTHAEYVLLPETAVAEIPHNLSLFQAGGQTLPYVTAYYSLITKARIQPGETVLIIGALGQVGHAAMSICSWKKCNPIALVRTEQDVQKASLLHWKAYSALPSQTFDAILNTIGNVQWNNLLAALNPHGRMIIIAAPPGKRDVQINLLDLYRQNKDILGINTVSLDYTQNAQILNAMKPGFESGALIPLSIDPATTFPLTDAEKAYQLVQKGSGGKRVLLHVSEIN
jgi:NADPH2:quinone reductase